jgi:hypothetical protein
MPGGRQILTILKIKPVFTGKLHDKHKNQESRMTPRFGA